MLLSVKFKKLTSKYHSLMMMMMRIFVEFKEWKIFQNIILLFYREIKLKINKMHDYYIILL